MVIDRLGCLRDRVDGLATATGIATLPDGVLADVGVGVVGDAVDVEPQRRIAGVVQAGDLDHGARLAVAVAADLDLCALVVELGVATAGAVQRNVLEAHEVLARRRVARDLELDSRFVPRAPVLVVLWLVLVRHWVPEKGVINWKTYQVPAGRGLADEHLVDFEPVALATVLAHIAGRLGHVDGQGPGVLHGGVVPQLGADGVAGHDLGHLGLGRVVERPRVAPEVVAGRVQELLGRHDTVAVLADVLEVVGQLAVDDELAPPIVRLGRVGCGERPEGHLSKIELHGCS